MNNISKFFRLFIFILFFAAFIWIAFYNSDSVKIAFCRESSYRVPLYAVILVSFLLGWLLSYLYSLVGSVKSRFKILSLNKKLSSLEEKIKELLPKKEDKDLQTKENSSEDLRSLAVDDREENEVEAEDKDKNED